MSSAAQARVNQLDARACLSSYLVLGGIFLGLTIFGLYVAINSPAHDWNFVYIPAAILAFCRALAEVYSPENHRWRTFLPNSILDSLYQHNRYRTRLFGTSRGPYRALLVYPRAEKTQKQMRVNI